MIRQVRITARPLVWAGPIGALAAVFTIGAQLFAAAPGANKACGLLTAAELAAVLGGKVSGWKGDTLPGVELCTGETPTARIMLRLFKKTQDDHTEAEGIKIAKQMGAQFDAKTFGPSSCWTMVPPKNLEQYGFTFGCTVDKRPWFAVLEVTAKSRKDMVSIDKLHPLAQKMSGRF